MLSHAERVTLLRLCASRLKGDREPETRWLGDCLMTALLTGQSLDDAFGYRPARGSHATAAQMIRRAEIDAQISTLVDKVGVVPASRMLRNQAQPPDGVMALVVWLRGQRIGTSPSALSRAVARHRR